jgi:hypothetical protein
MRQRNYYGILGVSLDATHSDIRSSYYSRARVIHPDRFDPINQRKEWDKANEMLAELNEAYSVLRNPQRRSEYDAEMGYRRTAESRHNETRTAENPAETESKQEEYQPPMPSTETPDEDSEEERTSHRGPAHVGFGSLPSEIKAKLLDRQSGRGRHLAWRTKTLRMPFGLLIFAIGWTVAVFYLTNDYRWTGNQTVAYGGITIVSGLVCWHGVMGIWKWKQSPLKAYVFLTPLYFIKTTFDDIWYWRLGQLVELVPVNHYRNGSYSHTTVTFIFDEGKESIGIQSIPLLQDLIEKLKTWGDQSRAAFQNRDWDYFVRHDDFLELQGQIPNHTPKPFIRTSRWVMSLIAAVCVGILVAVGAIQLNSYFDDKKSWDDATVFNRAPGYRKYLETHSSGRGAAEAKRLIQQQYDLTAHNYQASRSTGFDNNASAAILNALNYAKETQHYVVRVAFERHNEIPSNIERLLKDQFGVSNILSVGDSFSEAKMRAREREILSAVGLAFKEVIPEDILEFNDSGPSENNVTFLITYKMKGGNSLYYRHQDINVPLESRQFYPGIYISWNFELRVPTESSSPYRFSVESNPADHIQYQTSSYASETETLYERMTESAFDDFRQELVKRMGLKQANIGSSTPIPSPTPTPTPDVSGEFTNEFGTLGIDHLGVKGFSFDINIGTGRCTGTVSGKARWLKNGVAVYRVIPDESEYANPESSYYQKTCQLTFKLSEVKVDVSQTQGCTYFHGAECAFNGSYRR